jgi:hypothetical protein
MNMKKQIIAVMLIVVISLTGLYYVYQDKINNTLHVTKPALKIRVTTDYNDSLGVMEITTMKFEQTTVPIYYRSADDKVEFPNIEVEARTNELTVSPSSYWVSSKRISNNATYDFVMTFREPYPSTDALLVLTIKMNDFRGYLEYKTTAFYQWK